MAESVPRLKPGFQEIKTGQLNTKASSWNESHMQRGRLRNREKKGGTPEHWGLYGGTNKSLILDLSHSPVKLQTVAVKQIPKKSLMRSTSP